MDKEALKALLGDDLDVILLAPIETYLDELAIDAPFFPPVAIGISTIRIDESGPVLRALIDRAADGVRLNEGELRQLFLGVHILGGARYTPAWQSLSRLLRRPIDELDDLLGDAITETLPQIVAGVFDGGAGTLFDLILDLSVDDLVREALLKAATFLTWEGSVDADRMQQFLIDLDEKRLLPDGDMVWLSWVDAIVLLRLRSLEPRAHKAFDDGRIFPEIMDRSDFQDDLAAAEQAADDAERFSKARLGFIDDVLKALEWANHGEADHSSYGVPADDNWFTNGDGYEPGPWAELPFVQTPVTNPYRHVGRNDPCPCGSGKKAKKCCLS